MAKRHRAPKDDLNPRQLRFCEEYVVDLNAEQSAVRAGYSPKSASQMGSRLLTLPKVHAKIQHLKMVRSAAVASRAETVIGELSLLSTSDIRDFVTVTEDGRVIPKPLHLLPPGASRCISKIKFKRTLKKLLPAMPIEAKPGEQIPADADAGKTIAILEETFEFQLWDKVKPLDLLGQYHLLWNQNKPGGLTPDEAAAGLARIAEALEVRDGD